MASLFKDTKICTCEMHTAGEPLRIVTSGYPEIKGKTILEKRSYCKKYLDDYRKLLMHEPRGHYDMFGAMIVPPDEGTEADFGVLFMHNEGYGVMCGHATIALGRFAIDQGLIGKDRMKSPETPLKIQCPCGVVEVFVQYENGKTGRVRFNSVSSFAYAIDYSVEVEGFGSITVDIGFGGTFYAILPASRLGLDVRKSSVEAMANAAFAVHKAVTKTLKLEHPVEPDLSFLYGTILTDERIGNEPGLPSAQIVQYADKAIDRCPCGSGVTSRMAVLSHRGLVKAEETCTFEGVVQSKFTGKVVHKTKVGHHDAVRVEIAGKAHYSGQCTFTVEEDDSLSPGFILH